MYIYKKRRNTMTQFKTQLTQTKENRENMSVRKTIRKRTRSSRVADSQSGRQSDIWDRGGPTKTKQKENGESANGGT